MRKVDFGWKCPLKTEEGGTCSGKQDVKFTCAFIQ